jgi:RNA polymerase sigma-70 factor (ECF subfamily)
MSTQLLHGGDVAEVCEQYGERVFNLARWFVLNPCDAEDVTQDVFLQVVRKLATFRGESELTTWLHRVTVNAALGHRRKARVKRTVSAIGSLERLLDRGQALPGRRRRPLPPDQQAQARELGREIDRAIARLPKKYRQVFLLADMNKMSTAAIAGLLGIKLGAAKSRLHRARCLLRTYLTPYLLS